MFFNMYLFCLKGYSETLKHYNDAKAFIEHSNDIDNIYESINKYVPNKKQKIIVVFDDMIADTPSNK